MRTEEQKQKALDAANERQGVKGNGWLMKRGKWYVACWKYNGKLHKKTTKETTEAKARAKLAEFTAPYRMKRNNADFDAVAAALGAAKEKNRREQNRLPALAVADAFSAFSALEAASYLSKLTLNLREKHLTAFAKWLDEREGRPVEMREVGPVVAREYLAAKRANRTSLQSCAVFVSHAKATWKAIAEAEAERAEDKANDALAEFAGLPLARLQSNPWEVVGRDYTARAIRAKGAVTVGREPFTREEVEKIFATAKGELLTLCKIGLFTGLRLGDCACLKWENIKLDEGATGILEVKPHKTERSSGAVVRKALGRELHDVLAKVPTAKERRGFVMPEMAARYFRECGSKRLDKIFAKLLEDCGIENRKVVEGGARRRAVRGFHSFRYSYVSSHLNAGEDIEKIRAEVGHATSTMTMHYWKKSDAMLEREAAAVGAMFGETSRKAAQKPQKAVAAFLGALGRVDVADAQKPVFDAVSAMLANLAPETLRAVAAKALELAMKKPAPMALATATAAA